MPGIVGIVGKGSSPAYRGALQGMLDCMMHEPFYTCGSYINEGLGIWAGWVDQKGSFSDVGPIWNESRDICLLFSGEDYRDLSDLSTLKTKGHQFDGGSASYLVHLYEEEGNRFFEMINGWFSGVLLDFRNNSVRLFNDRYGLKRVYYHEGHEAFFFSSEAKSLLRVMPTLRQIDNKGLAETISCGCVLQNRTLFKGVSILPGGSCWEFNRGNIKRVNYFSPSKYEEQEPLSPNEFYDQLKETWIRIIPRYLKDENRVGMSLTGGVDCRMIMAWVDRQPNTLPCYTFGGMLRDSEDVKIARRVATISQQPHTVIRVGQEFIDRFPGLAERTVYITDGAMNVSGSADLYANQLSRKIAPIRITGNYGQEILRSAIAFRPKQQDPRIFDGDFYRLLQQVEETYCKEMVSPKLSFIVFKQLPWHHFSRLALESSQLTVRSPYIDNDLVALSYRAPKTESATKQIALRLISEGSFSLSRIATDRGEIINPFPVVSSLKKAYKNFTFKAEYAFDYGMPKWLVKIGKTISFLNIDRRILGRHKFNHYRIWYRDRFSDYIRDILLSKRAAQRGYVNESKLEYIVAKHVIGEINATLEIHNLLTLELLHRVFIDENYN